MAIKKHETKAVTVYIYNSFKDPLFQNLMYDYILTLNKEKQYRFYLITFEQPAYKISEHEKKKIRKNLLNNNISWYPKKFHTGKALIFKKIFDLVSAFLLVLYLKVVKKSDVIWAFANVSASQCIIFSKLLTLKLVIYSYEPHSSFMADLGYWSKASMRYKLLSTLEDYAGREADYILTGTKYMLEKLHDLGSKAKVFRAPTSVDESKFVFSFSGRTAFRKQHKLEDKKVILYLGKFGGLYYNEEIVDFFRVLHEYDPSYFFLVVTKDDHKKVQEYFFQRNIDKGSYLLASSSHFTETIKFISASDIGLNAIPSTPAQKYRSPTKIAEYLLCGLPYITCRGVSEDDLYANKYGVGVVVEDFSEIEVKKAAKLIQSLLSVDEDSLRNKCREVGLSYRAKSNVDKTLKKIFEVVFN